jgi:dipeptidyl aminopeptidase/acylaminoacyl peptidase
LKNLRWPRVLRLTVFGVFATLLALDVGAAWLYVRALTHPACGGNPDALSMHPIPQEIQLKTADGLTLDAWYYPSQNGAAVIMMGGMGGSLGSALPRAAPLLEAGYGILQIESRACAEPRSPVTLGFNEALDAEAGLQYLLQKRSINAEQIGIYGFSMGGVAAIRAAARNPEIAAVLAEGGYHNLGEDILESDRPVPPPLWQRIFLHTVAGMFRAQTGVNPWASSPIDDLPAISPRPVLLVYGEGELVSGRGREQYEAASEPKELWVVPGGAHGANHLAAGPAYDEKVLAFFDRALLGECAQTLIYMPFTSLPYNLNKSNSRGAHA